MDELRRMGATLPLISSNLRPRLDGMPYASQAQPQDTGVAVYFKLKGQNRVLACDKWNRIEHNLWAIRKHIESLRGQARWGVGNMEQAFAGYTSLPEKAGGVSWWEALGVTVNATADQISAAYREKAKTAHPDTGGSHEAMALLNEAYRMALGQLPQERR